MQLEAYKYSRLKEASGRFKQGAECNFECEWKINIGEYAQDIQVNKGKGVCDVYVLGEHSLFGIKLGGHLKIQKKLEYVPSCMTVFQEDMVLIGSFSSHLLLYKGRKLLWAARMNSIPVYLKVENFDIKGLVVSLDEAGVVEVSYLGTNPMPYTVTSGGKQLDPAEADREYRKILASLNDPSQQEPSESMNILVQLDEVKYEDHIYEGYATTEWGAVVTTIKLGLKFSGETAKNVCIHVSTPENIECLDSPLFIPLLKSTTPAVTTLKFLTKPDLPSNSLTCQINLTYSISEMPRTATSSFELPFFQGCYQTKLQKDADYKITLSIKDPISGLSEIFPDFNLETPNALSVKYFDESHCTAILGKSGERCRLQASSFHALWLLTSQIVNRLAKDNLSYDDALPLQDFFAVIDKHFESRKNVKNCEDELAKLTEQYTAIQKRLLVRFKDKNPAPLNNLDYLLQLVHSQVAAAADNLEVTQQELMVAAQQLSCCVSLILELLRLRFSLDDKNFEILRNVMSPHVQNYDSGWEESTNSALTFLLRTKLAKSAKETTAAQTDLAFPQSTEKLKKHITIVFDRISKGSRVA
jgi:Bardet-Biedl syndrome 9 protein